MDDDDRTRNRAEIARDLVRLAPWIAALALVAWLCAGRPGVGW
jgi:hypothetical protein